jgi:DNA-binding FadR family transcriptional regulator
MPIHTLAVSNKRLYQQAADQIAQSIERGEYAPGAKLPAERDLALQLRVSRPTVREALIALEISGIVEVRVGSGAYVRRRDTALAPRRDTGASAFELIAARKLIEPQVAGAAAQTITKAELAGLRETLDLIETHTSDHVEKLEVDRLFHVGIAEATHNAVLVEVVEHLWKGMFEPIFAKLSERTRLAFKQYMTLADHRAIYGCIERRDAAAAHASMLAHLVNVELTLMHGEEDNRGAANPAAADDPRRPA